MYYFKYNDTNIEKYVVRFNRDELMNLRYNVFNNCSEIVHREIDSDEELNNSSRIRNLKKKRNGSTYHYSYDEYVCPKLVSYIDMLIRNDDKVVDMLFNERQSDIESMKDEDKKNKLIEYYNRIDQILSFELLITIDFNEPEISKRRTRKFGKICNKKRIDNK